MGGVCFLALLVGALFVPEWQVQRAITRSTVVNPEAKVTPVEVTNLENEYRKTYLQAAGGILAIIALIFTYRRVVVAEQGHITDRYTKAIEQLGATKAENKPNVEVRLGAIYALERIAQDSARDHWTIMEVLTAYVRQNAPAPEQSPTEENNEQTIAKGPATEIQAILTVLGRRKRDRAREQEGQSLDLSHSDLRGAKLDGAHMERAIFEGANLEGVNFDSANVKGARFSDAHMAGANFEYANLQEADFEFTHVQRVNFFMAFVEGAIFSRAHLEETVFSQAHVERADFRGAHLEGASFLRAVGLTVEQIKDAKGWTQARFNDAFLRELKSPEVIVENQDNIS
jgi:uncharacterized protein YjbI with pentapeptide repeats